MSYLAKEGFPVDMMEPVCISTPEEARKLGYLPAKKDKEKAEKLSVKYKKRDPGIPNSWPFKAQLMREQEAQRDLQREAHATAKENRIRERQLARQFELVAVKVAQAEPFVA